MGLDRFAATTDEKRCAERAGNTNGQNGTASGALSDRVCRPARFDHFCLALIVGYGPFRSLLNLTYQSAMASSPQMSPAVLDFMVAASLSIALCSLALVLVGWRWPACRLRGAATVSMVLLIGTYLCSGCGLFALLPQGVATTVLALVYAAAVVANVAWLVPFGQLGPRRCLTTLVCCIIASSLISFILGLLPVGGQTVALVAIALVSGITFNMLDAVSVGNPTVSHTRPAACDLPQHPRTARRNTLALLRELWSPLVVYISLTALNGLASAFFIADNPDGPSAFAVRIAPLAAAAFAAALAFAANRMLDPCKLFQTAFPVIAALLVVLPFVSPVFSALFQGALAFLNCIASISVLFLFIETARTRRAPVVSAVAASMLFARLGLFAALVAGKALGTQESLGGFVRTLTLVVACIYLLSMTLMILVRRRDRSAGANAVPLSSPEFAFNGPGAVDTAVPDPNAAIETTPAPSESPASAPAAEALEARVARLATTHQLTPREQDVVLLLARGRTAARVADELGISLNTARGYIQESYAKLGVHSKQELIDLFS